MVCVLPPRKLPSAKAVVTRIWLFVAAAAVASACGGSLRSPRADTCRVIGFVDDHTFRVEADGRAPSDHMPEGERRRVARDGAVDAARKKTLEIFSAGMIKGGDDRGISPERIVSVVERGEVVSERCDKGGRCRVLFEVRAKNLKQVTGY